MVDSIQWFYLEVELWVYLAKLSSAEVKQREALIQTEQYTHQEQHVRVWTELSVRPGSHQKPEDSKAQTPSQPADEPKSCRSLEV